ncbi:MAG: hypothetical protein ACRDXX_11430 [Stackebrandtia sp.]
MWTHLPLRGFDPLDGAVILTPERNEPGYWSGSPGIVREPESGRFILTYRQRRPRGADRDRGWRCAVAVSDDGEKFTDVWSVEKDELDSPSMERFCLAPLGRDRHRLYISYVDPSDNRWRVDALADAPLDSLDIATATPVLTAAATGTEGVKDPYVIQAGPVTYLFASYAEASPGLGVEAHQSADIYNVGVTTHPTGVATSLDGRDFTWHGSALTVGDGWDRYQARLNSVVPLAGGYVGFYDGSASADENYEERCGIAVSGDLWSWRRLSPDRPWVVSPHATGSVRYLDALLAEGEWWLYYELTRPDGAHELRLARIPDSPA